MRLSETNHPIAIIESDDYGSAGIDSTSVHMGKVHSLTAAFAFGAVTGNSVLKVYSGASSGTKTTALAFKYRLGSADFSAASADVLGAATSVAATGLTLTAATFDHRLVTIDVDSDTVDDDEPYLTFEIDSTASVLNLGAVAFVRPRDAANTAISIL